MDTTSFSPKEWAEAILKDVKMLQASGTPDDGIVVIVEGKIKDIIDQQEAICEDRLDALARDARKNW